MADATKNPSSLGTIKFPVLSSILLLVGVLLLTWIFHSHKEWHDSMNFGIAAGALAAGILGAYYVGRALAQTIEQRSESITDQKIARAFEFLRRWNDPALAQIKANFRELIESGKAHLPDHVETLLEADKAKRPAVVEVLNFFEELAIAVHTGVADNDTLSRAFREKLNEYDATLQPWIKQHRSSKKSPTMWIELEELVEKWNS